MTRTAACSGRPTVPRPHANGNGLRLYVRADSPQGIPARYHNGCQLIAVRPVQCSTSSTGAAGPCDVALIGAALGGKILPPHS